MARQKTLIVVGGPTASGKTSLAIQLAQHFQTEILSGDSRQFYKEMSIGTAKPSDEEMAQVPHHFIGHLSIHDPYSAGDFETEATNLITELFKTKDQIILAGGSGLFLKAVTEGLDEFPDIDPNVRIQLNAEYEKNGISFLQKELQKVDPVYYKQVDLNNSRRIIRALEIFRTTGNQMRFYQKGTTKKRPYSIVYLQPHWEREKLYDRINLRVEHMFDSGLEKEVKSLEVFKDLSSLQTVGYQELFSYFSGEIELKTAKSLIKQNSRRYAKRQLTWARQRGQWVLLKKDFTQSALQFLSFVAKGWDWKIEQLDRPEGGHNEEKTSRIIMTSNEHIGEIIIAKKPKVMQAYWNVSKHLDIEIQHFLLDQLSCRADSFELVIWSKSENAIIFKDQFELSKSVGHFPFESLTPAVSGIGMYRRLK